MAEMLTIQVHPIAVRTAADNQQAALNNGEVGKSNRRKPTAGINCNSTLVTTPDSATTNIEGTAIGERDFFLPHQRLIRPVDIEFQSVTYSVPEKGKKELKQVVKSVSGKFNGGQLVAIMGPSGAGKSSLLNLLTGYRTKSVTGIIRVGGRLRDLRKFRKMSCYIMQNDQLLPHLTTEEIMMCSANLKLSVDIGKDQKQKIVDEILDMLGLSATRHTRIANLSGGEHKRLSIAVELVSNPPLMFLDEPTTGLDSASCYQCVTLLKSLTQGGRTVVCTIHQPTARLLELYDHLFMMADGQCIYQGSIPGLVQYLSAHDLICPPYHNPADFMMEVACGEHGSIVPRMVDTVREYQSGLFQRNGKPSGDAVRPSFEPRPVIDSDGVCEITVLNGRPTVEDYTEERKQQIGSKLCCQVDSPFSNIAACFNLKCDKHVANSDVSESSDEENEVSEFATSSWVHFVVLLRRTSVYILRDSTLTRMRLAAHIFVGLMIGFMCLNIGNKSSEAFNNVGAIFFSLMFLMFTAITPTILALPIELSVLVQEHLNHWYNFKSYYFAKTLADIPFQILFTIIFGAIFYWMTNQPNDVTRFLAYLLICTLTSIVSQSIGLLTGAVCSIQTAVFVGPIAIIPVLLFSGFFINLQSIPVHLRWLSYLSFTRYAFEGVAQVIYGWDREPLDCDQANKVCLFGDPKVMLKELNSDEADFRVDIAALCVYFVVVRVLGFIVLRMRIGVE